MADLVLVRRSHAARPKRSTVQDKTFLVHRRPGSVPRDRLSARRTITWATVVQRFAQCRPIHHADLHRLVYRAPNAARRKLFYAATHHGAHPVAYSRDHLLHLSANF